jgi:hypothetical protein
MSFEGHVEGFALTDFLQAIQCGGRTGLARVTDGDRSTTILFERGKVECVSCAVRDPLGAVLVNKRIITCEDLARALRAQRERHRHYLLATLIADMGLAPFTVLEEETAAHIRDVFTDLLGWERGVFVFQPHEMPREVTVLAGGLDVEELLLTGMFAHETASSHEIDVLAATTDDAGGADADQSRTAK